MVYYKVKKEYDNIHKDRNKTDIYIENELYTEKEIEKQNLKKDYMDKIEVSKKQIYWCFGARFV